MDNPFDDPFTTGDAEADNPFASTTPAFEDDNPFATPAPKPIAGPTSGGAKKKRKKKTQQTITASTGTSRSSGSAAGGGAGGGSSAGGYTAIGGDNDTFDSGASMFSKPAGSSGLFSGVGGDVDRVEALTRKEAELEAKQLQLAQKEEELKALMAKIQGLRPANWPRCRPIIHHDIAGEIPMDGRSMVRKLYMTYYATIITLTWNCIVQISALIAKTGSTIGLALSILYMVAGPFCALGLWYYPVYNAFRTGKSTKFVQFFLFFAIAICFYITAIIGIPKTGLAGIITAIDLSKSGHQTTTILCVVNIFCFIILAVCCIALIKAVHNIYRGYGGDLSRDASLLAKQGAAQGAVAVATA